MYIYVCFTDTYFYFLRVHIQASFTIIDHMMNYHKVTLIETKSLRNFTKFTGKYLFESHSFNKVTGLRPATLLKDRLSHRCCPMNFAKFLNTVFREHLRWLLLSTPGRVTSKSLFLKVKNECIVIKCSIKSSSTFLN